MVSQYKGLKIRACFCLIFLPLFALSAQDLLKYRVFLKDKIATGFDPFSYFDQKAIERRIMQKLPLYDWYDLPVTTEYIDEIAANSTIVKTHSRWLNAVVVMATTEQLAVLGQLPFVTRIEEGKSSVLVSSFDDERPNPVDSNSALSRQITRMGSATFEEKKLNGNGIRIAIFDVGFSGADKHEAFEHLRKANRIVKTWDFVKNKENVWQGGSHGTSVWSCIAGRIDDQWSGMAWDAEFLLARTEIGSREPFSEEENWVAAAEWADKNGADIINSSLGYTDNRYFPEDMDGKTSYITRGANIAAKKGLLIINAAGNEGSDDSWQIIGAPADADSVLSIGGVQVCCDYHISFSSFGPTHDLRLKPNLCAQGHTMCAKPTGTGETDGTSFSSPLVAGFAACAWQAKRGLTNMELFKALEKCGSLYPYYDYAHGYGIPSAERFLDDGKKEPEKTFTIEMPLEDLNFNKNEENSYNIVISDKYFTSEPPDKSQLLYYSILDNAGKIKSFYVIEVTEKTPLTLMKYEFYNKRLRFYYKGYMEEINPGL